MGLITDHTPALSPRKLQPKRWVKCWPLSPWQWAQGTQLCDWWPGSRGNKSGWSNSQSTRCSFAYKGNKLCEYIINQTQSHNSPISLGPANPCPRPSAPICSARTRPRGHPPCAAHLSPRPDTLRESRHVFGQSAHRGFGILPVKAPGHDLIKLNITPRWQVPPSWAPSLR